MPYDVIDKTTAKAAPSVSLGAPLTSVGETLDSMSQELLLVLGGRADIDPVRLTRWINQAYIDLASSLDLPQLYGSIQLVTDVNQPLYLLPDNVLYTKGAALVDPTFYPIAGGRPLQKKSIDWYRTAVTTYTGDPDGYFLYDGMLVLWPTPASSINIGLDVAIKPQLLANPTDSSILGTEWDEGIILGARAKAFSGLLEFDMAMAAQNDFVNWVRRRNDMKAAEDDGRVPLSSVPRSSRQLRNGGRGRWPERNRDIDYLDRDFY